jgi:hypothetical protein
VDAKTAGKCRHDAMPGMSREWRAVYENERRTIASDIIGNPLTSKVECPSELHRHFHPA